MTAPDQDAPVDPVECMESRAFKGISLCGEPDSTHCPGCELCPGNCACPPATKWKKGDRVSVTFEAVYYAEPSIKPDRYALVVLPGTNLDTNPLILDRFRVPLTAMTLVDPAEVENLKHSKETS